MSMLGSILLLVIKKNIVLQTFEFCSDCRCDRHFTDIKTKFSIPREKYVKPCHEEEKYLSNDKKDFRALCNFDFDVCLISA